MSKARDLANLGSNTAALATDAEVSSAVAPKANTTDVNSALAAKADSSTVSSHTGASTGVHGATGSVVGTSDSQTLTNKTLTDPKINLALNTQTASYTLVLADAGKHIEMNVGSANNLTVPPNADVAFPIGTQILISQYGAGQTTIVAGSGVTVRSADSKLKIAKQYAQATLVKRDANEWYLSGNLAA